MYIACLCYSQASPYAKAGARPAEPLGQPVFSPDDK